MEINVAGIVRAGYGAVSVDEKSLEKMICDALAANEDFIQFAGRVTITLENLTSEAKVTDYE